MASKAELIEQANQLRRNFDQLFRANRKGFRQHVTDVAASLREAGLSSAEVTALLPPPMLAPDEPCRLRPLADHVVLRPAAPKAVSDGGIVIPDVAHEVPMRGEVLAVGPGRVEPQIGTVVPAVAVGDEVLFGRYAGVQVQLDGEDVRIMREEDILGVLTPETA